MRALASLAVVPGLLVAFLARGGMAQLNGTKVCTAPCGEGRPLPGGVVSGSYCLVTVAQQCDYVSPSNDPNVNCDPCFLWKTSVAHCGGPVKSDPNCGKGYLLRQDDCAKTKWKIWPTKRAWKGFESMTTEAKSPSQMNYLWSAIWASALPGAANPCLGSAGYAQLKFDSAPYIATLLNAFGYRSQHTWHAHVGAAHSSLRDCLTNTLLPAITKAKAWTPTPVECTIPSRNGDVKAKFWANLQGPVSTASLTKAKPGNLAAVISTAYKKGGPLQTFDRDANKFTGTITTGVQWGRQGATPKNYYAVILYNYYDSWSASAGRLQVGEYELLVA